MGSPVVYDGEDVTSTPSDTGTERLAECWVRSLARVPDGPQGKVVRRLEWLVTDGRLDALTVETWPAAVPADRERLLGSHERTVHARRRAFADWADREGRDLGRDSGHERSGTRAPGHPSGACGRSRPWRWRSTGTANWFGCPRASTASVGSIPSRNTPRTCSFPEDPLWRPRPDRRSATSRRRARTAVAARRGTTTRRATRPARWRARPRG